MTNNLLHFTPRIELGARTNLSHLIELCRNSSVLNGKDQFDLDVWDIGNLKGRKSLHRAYFCTLDASKVSSPTPLLPQLFRDFSKAILILLQDKRPVVSTTQRMTALRCMEAALCELNLDSRPTAVNVDVLDLAVDIARRSFSPDVTYRIAGQLELISEFMNSCGLIKLRTAWSHGQKKPNALGSRISKESLQARHDKLPTAATLRALAAIFQDAVKPMDVFVSSMTSLMLCAPERINEVVRIRRNCIVNGEGRFVGKLGLRWAGSKGANDTTKWLPTQMTEIARKAISNILALTEQAHEVATWYTLHPGRLFLHAHAQHLREKETLTLQELALLLWGDPTATKTANTWATHTNGLPRVSLGGRSIGFSFKDVERAVIDMLPSTFPYVPGDPNLRCMDALAVLLTNEGHEVRPAYLCMFTCTETATITGRLGGLSDRPSIFDHFGYTEDDGTPITLRSHSLRHYLNMLAQMGGLSSAEIAIFSGRKDERQNRAYDHRTSEEIQAPITAALKAGFTGSLLDASKRTLIDRNEFPRNGVGAAHTTEFGWCLHNFASEPCQVYRDCINCEEQVCIKGDMQKESNLRLLEQETESLLMQAKSALSDEEFGSDNWVRHQTKTLERVRSILKIMLDGSVPNGARIRLDLCNAPLIKSEVSRVIDLRNSSGVFVQARR